MNGYDLFDKRCVWFTSIKPPIDERVFTTPSRSRKHTQYGRFRGFLSVSSKNVHSRSDFKLLETMTIVMHSCGCHLMPFELSQLGLRLKAVIKLFHQRHDVSTPIFCCINTNLLFSFLRHLRTTTWSFQKHLLPPSYNGWGKTKDFVIFPTTKRKS